MSEQSGWPWRLMMKAGYVLLAAVALSMAWALVRPMLPLFAIGGIVIVAVKFIRWRQRFW